MMNGIRLGLTALFLSASTLSASTALAQPPGSHAFNIETSDSFIRWGNTIYWRDGSRCSLVHGEVFCIQAPIKPEHQQKNQRSA